MVLPQRHFIACSVRGQRREKVNSIFTHTSRTSSSLLLEEEEELLLLPRLSGLVLSRRVERDKEKERVSCEKHASTRRRRRQDLSVQKFLIKRRPGKFW